jgi:hypothetical protein
LPPLALTVLDALTALPTGDAALEAAKARQNKAAQKTIADLCI